MKKQITTDSYKFDEFGFLHVDAVLSHEGTLNYFDETSQTWQGAYMPIASLAQMAKENKGAAVTLEHPTKEGKSVLLDEHNFKSEAIGYLSNDPLRVEGNNLVGTLIVADAKSQQAILSGSKKGVSLGYTEYQFPEKGADADGKEYQTVKKGLRLNHIALVEEPRAEKALISLDSLAYTLDKEHCLGIPRLDSTDFAKLETQKNNQQMETKKDQSVDQLLQMQSDLIKLQTNFDSIQKELQVVKAEKDALSLKLTTAEESAKGATAALDSYKEAQPSQEVIDEMVEKRVAAWHKANGKVAFDSKMTELDIQRARLALDFPNKAEEFKTASVEYLNAFESAFDSLKSSVPVAPKPLFNQATDSQNQPVVPSASPFKDQDGSYSLFNLKAKSKRGN
jgi:hypothetical protein